jgi:hypothetical protein
MTIDRSKLKLARPEITEHSFISGKFQGEKFYVKRLSARQHGIWLGLILKASPQDQPYLGGLYRVAMCWCDAQGNNLFNVNNPADIEELAELDQIVIGQVDDVIVRGENLTEVALTAKKN